MSPIMRGGKPVPGFALGDERPENLRVALKSALYRIRSFTRTLTPREEAILKLGLAASHLEESVAHGDWKRAEAHADKVSDLFERLTKV